MGRKVSDFFKQPSASVMRKSEIRYCRAILADIDDEDDDDAPKEKVS